ncbi:pro-neuregulin-3, membrane-bound isoform [Genypterus blacodes]|uniref:pro-neuregulin-3, membrane-bound isoform n=1 Tax=Genypterus blacodes TaxID=154954 RepID=UPI003F764087
MSHNGRHGRMTECSGAAVSGAVILEEPEGSGGPGTRGEGQAQDQAPVRACPFWPRQQTWLCVVPLLIGFIGLGLSLMLLKWIVVGTVQDYVPTDLVDANRIGQDPIFLSKPSGIPRSPDTTTTTTTTVGGGNPTGRTVTVPKGRTRSATTTTATNPRGGGASGSQVTPRNPVNRNGRGPSGVTTTAAAPRSTFRVGVGTPSPSPLNPTVLHDSTQLWMPQQTTTEAPSTMLTTRTHSHRKTPAPTLPPLHSEHFKPCQEKDLTYCLNGGECFVIETLSGPHKHCKCREGYQGIRCDQFLPKTDSIPSDPINHLGIEFMESKDVYKRQVLSITSIAMAISLLGTLCMALYYRNKRRREKLQAHLKESRILKNYAANSHHALETKARTANNSLQMHEYCKRTSSSREEDVCEARFPRCNTNSCRGSAKNNRISSLSHSPDQRAGSLHWSVPRRTPPIPRGRLNPIGGSKYSGPAYQHLQEVESSEKEAEAQRGVLEQADLCSDPRQDSFLHMQTSMETSSSSSSLSSPPWSSRVKCEHQILNPTTRSLRRPGRRHSPSPPPPFRSCSIPIIPSVQCHHDNEVSCMQTNVAAPPLAASVTCGACKEPGRARGRAQAPPPSSSCSSAVGQRRDEVALLLEEAQEQLRSLALAHMKQEEGGVVQARETVCFLNPSGGGAGALSCGGPTETLLLSPAQSHRDLGHLGQ